MVIRDLQETGASLLKHHTTKEHQALEAIVLPHLQALRTIEDYVGLLKIFYGYHKPIEECIATQLHESHLPDLEQRRKADWILQDLTFSIPHNSKLPVSTNVPEINNCHQAFGALYVLEGSTLGGRGITKMLLKNQHLQLEEKQVRFFSGYGTETGAKWMNFLNYLNQQNTGCRAMEQMIGAANETFTLFKNWIQENEA